MGEERETEKEKGEGMEKEGGRDGGRGDFHLVSREPIRPLAASCLTQLLSLDTLVHQLFQYISQLYPANKKGTVAHFWQTTPPSPPRLLFWGAAPSECAGANVCTSKERKRAGVSDRAGILLCRGL